MKKYTLFLFVSALFITLLGFNFKSVIANTDNLGCSSAGPYSTTTGKPCSIVPAAECAPGHLFSMITGKPCHKEISQIGSSSEDLKVGSRGEKVKIFQQILTSAGFAVKIDGIYGPLTNGASEKYYKKYPCFLGVELNNMIGHVCPLPPIEPPIKSPVETPTPIACTLEAKQCPDGSYVSRSLPNCEFAICPTVSTVIKAPTISSLSPITGAIGGKVTIYGNGFTATGNTVNFGTGVIPNLDFTSSTTLTFAVPSALTPACYFSKPACYLPSVLTPAGNYAVSVTNANGTSNALSFTVTNNSITSQ